MLLFLALVLALPDALLNRPYIPEPAWERVGTRCGMPIPVTRVVSGALPAGMRISGRGDLEGSPTEPGLFRFTVEVSDGCSRRLDQRQIRVLPATILTAEAETLEFHCPLGATPFSGGVVRVSGSAPGRAYSIDILDGPWLQAVMRDGVLPLEGSALEADTIRLSVNPSKLAAGSYSARLRLSTWQGANAPELLFRLRVDSPESIFPPVAVTPMPTKVVYQIIEVPSVQLITPPPVARPDPPRFPPHQPHSKSQPKSVRPGAHSGRSRVLPFPKITIPLANPVKPPDTQKKEAPPQRTKPSAMPPHPAASQNSGKPKAAH